ncbi:MAG: LysR family transcriptional regulator [Gordonibacter sp.]|uniref:LysR family transcriptional regulator n=1 Tax=Gordonibacter sp. TaxID=1968902 RepID=UPI002FC9071E
MEVKDKYDYFILAYDAPSFSAGASKVPMSPQGFTKAIRNLERELGVTLFTIDEDGIRRSTPYADEFYEYAKHMQTERNLLASAFERIASSGYVEIRVASSLGIPGLLGSNFLADFQNEYKDVSITLNELPDTLCESVVRDGMYDLALTILPSADDFVTHELYYSPVCYWVHRDDPLSKYESLGIEDIARRRIAIPGHGFKCCRLLLDRFQRENIEPLGIVEYSEIFWIYEFVLRGEGIGFSLPHLAQLEVFRDHKEVVAVPLRDFSWGFGVSYLKGRSLCKREEEFIEYLEKQSPRGNLG